MKYIYRGFMMLGLLISLLPTAFADEAVVGNVDAGKKIFTHVCLYCHTNNEDSKIGPSLVGIGDRRSVAWLQGWLKNPGEMIKKDEDAKVLRGYSEFNMTMPPLPSMKDDQKRADVIAYLLKTF